MASAIQEVRALLMQFERSALQDLYWSGREWSVFMARDGGAANPMLTVAEPVAIAPAQAPAAALAVTAPHLGLFAPCCAVGEGVEQGALIGLIDVLGRKTEVLSTKAGRVSAICAAANGLVEFGDALVEIAVAA